MMSTQGLGTQNKANIIIANLLSRIR